MCIRDSSGTVKIRGKSVVEMDALTGKLQSYSAMEKNGELIIKFNLPPAASLLLFISDKEIKKYESDNEHINAQIIQEESPCLLYTSRCV